MLFVVATVISLTAMSGVSAAGALQVGKKNKSSAQTTLTSSSKKKAALAVRNTGGAAAASFTVKKNKAPFTVSSSTKVKSLNADLLDGLDSSQLQRRVGGSCGEGSAIRIINADGTVSCQPVLVSVPPAWNLTGNAGTDPTADFLGTTDAQPLVIRTNNTEAMRVTAGGAVGVGTTTPDAQLQALGSGATTGLSGTSSTGNGTTGRSDTGIGVLGDSNARGIVGTLGGTSCAGNYAVGGCGASVSEGVLGDSNSRGVIGTLGGTSCAGTYAVGGCGATLGDGVLGNSTNGNGVDATGGLNGIAASGGANGVVGTSSTGIGVRGDSPARGVVGTLGGTSCAGTYAVGGCGADIGDGVDGSSRNNGVVGISSHASGGNTAAAVLANNTGGGDIFIAQANGTTKARIDSTGKGFFDGGTQTGGADYAESIRAVDGSQLRPGDVLAIAPSHGYAVAKSNRPYSQLVVGVYSTRPAVLAVGANNVSSSLAGRVPVAMMGVVPTKVTAAGGAIRPGDLLTSSGYAGYAMKAKSTMVHGIAIYPQGTIVGKALEPLSHGQGAIEVMLMSR